MSFSQVRKSLGYVGQLLAVFALVSCGIANAAEWIGGAGSWDSVSPAVPGWDTALYPNAIGAVANRNDSSIAATTTQNIFGGVTLGSITYTGTTSGAGAWTLTLTEGLTLNQDGAGAGVATISNTNTVASTTSGVVVGAVGNSIVLADDLLVSNTGGSTRGTGSIAILGTLSSTTDVDVVFHSVAPIGAPTTAAFGGGIRLQNGANDNTFTGTVLVRKGLVAFNGVSFGNSLNSITLGQAGQGDAMMLSTASTGLVANDITVAGGSGGTLTVGGAGNTTYAPFSGNFTLNGDLTIRAGLLTGAASAAVQTYAGSLSGAGGLTKTGMATALLSGTNTYAGPTEVVQGNLHFSQRTALYNATPASWTASNILVNSDTTLTLSVGGLGEFTSDDVGIIAGLGENSGFADGDYNQDTFVNAADYVVWRDNPNGVGGGNPAGYNTWRGNFGAAGGGGFSGGFDDNSTLALNTASGDYEVSANISNANDILLAKVAANKLTLSGTNTVRNRVVAGTLQFANRNALFAGNTANWTPANLTVQTGTTAVFNVGGAGEFMASDIDIIKSLGDGVGGFLGAYTAGANPGEFTATTSNLGFDTTNATDGTFAYGSNIGDSNSAATPLSITKIGTGELVLTGTNTYSGNTIVNGGTLRLSGGSHIVNPAIGTVTTTVGNYLIGSVAGTTGNIIFDGANITSDNGLMVGEAGTGTATVNSGTIILKADNAGGTQFLGIGRLAGSNGTWTQNGGDVLVGATGTNDWFVLGVSGTGTGTLNGGTIKGITFALGQNASGSGKFTLNNGSITSSGATRLGIAGAYEYEQTGGSLTAASINVAEQATSGGSFTLSGGTITSSGAMRLGIAGPYSYKQTGGSLSAASMTVAETATTATGTFTLEGGTITTNNAVQMGLQGTVDYKQTGGTFTVTNGGQRFSLGEGVNGVATFDMSGGAINVVDDWFIFARNGQATGTLSGTGAITAGRNVVFSETATADSTFTMEGGTITAVTDIRVASQGKSKFNMHGGTVNITGGGVSRFVVGNAGNADGTVVQTGGAIKSSFDIVIAFQGSAQGKYTLEGGTLESVRRTVLGVQAATTGTMEMSGGKLTVGEALWLGEVGTGTLTHTGGEIKTVGWVLVGNAGVGTYNLNGGDLNVGDNFVLGSGTTGDGTVNMTSGDVVIEGNLPVYTGNLVVGDHGIGKLNMSGGTIDMTVGFNGNGTPGDPNEFGTNNSASFSVANYNVNDPEQINPLALAQDGNFSIAEEAGTGTVVLSGNATINVAANVFIGGGELDTPASPVFGYGGNGTLTIRDNAQLRVGTSSPTGGDFVLGSPAPVVPSVATVNLEGGVLDVTGTDGTYGGSIASGGSSSPNATFNFTGGTLRFREWNTSGPFGGSLGNLVQNGMGSLLDVATVDSTILSQYDLGEGAANIASGRSLTAYGVLNSTGAGVINLGQGGATANLSVIGGASTIDVDTLNLDNGSVTAGGGATVKTALTGSGSFSDNLTLAAGSTLTMDINGSTPVTGYDQIDVGGTLAVAGSVLQVNVGFTPTLNEQFDLLDFAGVSISGFFSSVNFSAGNWNTDLLYSDGIVRYDGGIVLGSSTAVPEPATWALLAMAFAGLIGARSVRSRRN